MVRTNYPATTAGSGIKTLVLQYPVTGLQEQFLVPVSVKILLESNSGINKELVIAGYAFTLGVIASRLSFLQDEF